jgi:hypothetical protein
MSDAFGPTVRVAAAARNCVSHVRIGIPLPRGWVDEVRLLSASVPQAQEAAGGAVAMQGRVLARWPDRSIKWLLTDLAIGSRPDDQMGGLAYELCVLRQSDAPAQAMRVVQAPGQCDVDTGTAHFEFRVGGDALISQVKLAKGKTLLNAGVRLVLNSHAGAALAPRVDSVTVAETGSVCTVVVIQGGFSAGCPLQFTVRCTLVQGSAQAVLDVRLRNPRAAMHVGGLWDLGDSGSFLMGEAAVVMQPGFSVNSLARTLSRDAAPEYGGESQWSILQDSSGGERWNSPNHLEADGRLGVSFQGYAVRSSATSSDGQIREARISGRAQPTLAILGDGQSIAVSVRDFWQNFPKSIEWANGELRVGLFPSARRCPVELQGGEQKRHRVVIAFGHDGSVIDDAQAALEPPHAWVDPQWVQASGAVRGLVADLSSSVAWNEHVRTVVDGPNSFIDRRELIDEYGWRNFGDLYADHEAVNHQGTEPFVTHYNNQYDFVWAAGLHALRTGDARWARLARECAEHTADIDVYHTQEDRPAFNGGLFWHTDHYFPAHTCTHRTYSAASVSGGPYGGGPSNEHNYASGLLLHYWRTGDEDAREAVIGLGDWVIAMDDGARSLLGLVDSGPTGKASQTVDAWYHGPGRGAGNSIASLMDAYLVDRNRNYLDTCEALIRRCIHPQEDIAKRGLDDIENRWSYLAFLQSVGRYIELKLELGEIDYMFQYARESLLNYADWMLQHEVPYKDVLHRVELPTESWPAHDIRKCHVFHLAARFDDRGQASVYAERAALFYERCLTDLNTFATRHLTRPLVLLSVYGHLHAYYCSLAPIEPDIKKCWRHDHQFGEPQAFVLPRERVKPLMLERLQTVRREVKRLVRDRVAAKMPKASGGRS